VSFNLQTYIDIIKKRQEEEALQEAANSVQLAFDQKVEAFRRRAVPRRTLVLARLRRERLLEDIKEDEERHKWSLESRVTTPNRVTVTENSKFNFLTLSLAGAPYPRVHSPLRAHRVDYCPHCKRGFVEYARTIPCLFYLQHVQQCRERTIRKNKK